MKNMLLVLFLFSSLGCAASEKKRDFKKKDDAGRTQQDLSDSGEKRAPDAGKKDSHTRPPVCREGNFAELTKVSTSGSSGAYQVSVTLKSPDLGCNQYANWWEILDTDGKLIYRRILGHSHVNEQPFTRTGGPAAIAEDQIVILRGHMNPDGYGTKAMKGSVKDGFQAFDLACDFAKELQNQAPLPNGCAF